MNGPLANVPGIPGVELGRQGRVVAIVDHERRLSFWVTQVFAPRPPLIPEGWVPRYNLWLQVVSPLHDDGVADTLTVWFDTTDITAGSACMFYNRPDALAALEAEDPSPTETPAAQS